MTFSPAFLDEIRARTSLSSLVQRTVVLKKAGVEWKGCCPFHGEKTPSFYVNDEKAFYHCFGCSAHGDAIRWLVEHSGLQFVDAVKELAAAAGLEIPASDPRQAERDREREEMLAIMRRAAERFAAARDGGLDYLRGRGIDGDVITAFEIGFAPSPRARRPLHEEIGDVAIEKLIALGLARQHPETGEIRDFFRNRIMIPIHDTRGRVIGFGGRVIGKAEPKYLNSPDTPLFDKGRTLFNAHRAAAAARKSGRLVIVEGYMDVIALYRAGVPEAVAPNGTALTEAQISNAWRMADTPICCFDADKAGRSAAARAAIRALPLLEPGKSLAFAFPPEGKDPDDVLREGGPAAVSALLASPRPLVDVLWEHERAAESTDTPEQVAGLKTRMRAHVRSIRNADVRRAYGDAILFRFERQFRGRAMATPPARSAPSPERQRFRRPRPASQAQRNIARYGMTGGIEQAVVIGLIQFPDLLRDIDGVQFRDVDLDRLVSALIEFAWRDDTPPDDAAAKEFVGGSAWQRLISGRPLPFSFARPMIVDPDRAYQDLVAAIAAMRSATSRAGAWRSPHS